jgi:hypothetical protein
MAGIPGTTKIQGGKEWIRRRARLRTDEIAVLHVVAVCGRCACPAAAHAPARQEPAIGGDFELNDSRGKPFRLSSQCGKAVPIFFGYTGYPDVCPTDLLPLTGSEARLPRVAKAYGRHFSYIGRTTDSTTCTVGTNRRTCTSFMQPPNWPGSFRMGHRRWTR